jgi:Mrp family chromosome partitioning ATPase
MNGPTFAATTAATPRGPRPPAPARPPHKAEADNPAARVLTYVRLHWLTILFAGALLGAGMGYAAWLLLPPKYESTALFRVSQVQKSVGSTGDMARNQGNFTTVVKTYAGLIKQEFVYRYALREYRLAELSTLKGQKDPQKFLDEKLIVSSKEGSEIITLSMVGEDPEDVRKIVDAMVKAYQQEVIQKEKTEANRYRDDLAKAMTSLEEQLKRKGGQLPTEPAAGPIALMPGGKDPLKPDAPPLGPDAPKVDPALQQAGAVGDRKPADPVAETDKMKQAMFNPLNARRAKLEESLPDLGFKIAKAKADIDAIKLKYQEILNEPKSPDLEKQVRENDPNVKALKDKADRLANQLAQKLATAKDPNAASIQRMQGEHEQAEVDVEKAVREKVKQFDAARRKPREDQAQIALDVANREYAILVANLNLNKSELEKVKAELKAIPTPAEVLRAEKEADKPITPSDVDLSVLADKYRVIAAESKIADLNRDAESRITKLQDASSPVQKDAQKQILGTVFASLLGFALVAGVCVGLEMRARKVSSLTELRAAAPVPVVGVVPHAPDADTARDPIKRAEVNESIDKLRAYVAQTWLARGATTVAVTSPLGDEGKSFTAFGLASSLAQAGMKTLLVDFDLRNPCLHTYAGVPNDLGVCELLRGEADFRRTIQVLPNGLHFLSGGKWSDDARQAAVGGRLEALLTRLKEPFDCVVLHADALLTVAESVEVARRSEVLLLCALYRTTRTPLLKKATDRAAAMEIPYTGVVYVGATASEALC